MFVRAFIVVIVLLIPGIGYAEAGDWLLRVGASHVAPKSDNHDVVEVEAGQQLTFNGTYFLSDVWAVEVLAALPFEHDIDLVGGGRVASTKHLPPTISMQYHLKPGQAIRPYVGLGVNITEFFEEDTTGALAGSDLELDRSIGLAAQLGVDFNVGEKMFINLEARYVKIETDAKLDGASLGTVEIDPWVFGLYLGWRI